MAQNTSTAVMARRIEPHDSLDDFPTPPWSTRALLQHVLKDKVKPSDRVWEPCANRGHMVTPLREFFHFVHGTDVHDYGAGFETRDFLLQTDHIDVFDWIFMNPPFRLAEQFIDRANRIASKGIAVFVRTSFLEGIGRYVRLFEQNPPNIIAQFTERVVLHKGCLSPNGSSATAYCWLVWDNSGDQARMVWIPPCRRELERPSDYAGYT